MKLSKRRILACFLAVMLCMAAFSIPAYAEGGDYQEYEIPPEENSNPEVLTPEGNMTLVDDITGEAANEKEFITVVTKNGHYFYIVIDRSDSGNNTVHFLNQVDEADLLALLSDEEKDAYLAEPQPTPAPEPTPIPTPVPTEKPSTEPDSSSIRGTVILVLFAVLGILVFFYLRSRKNPSPKTKGAFDPEDYDYGDDEDDDDEDYANQFVDYNTDSEEDGV